MALRRQPPPPEPCGCEQRIGELERTVAALARAAARNGAADDAYLLPGNRVIHNQPDAAVIRAAACQGRAAGLEG
jgi:hypothetical protein